MLTTWPPPRPSSSKNVNSIDPWLKIFQERLENSFCSSRPSLLKPSWSILNRQELSSAFESSKLASLPKMINLIQVKFVFTMERFQNNWGTVSIISVASSAPSNLLPRVLSPCTPSLSIYIWILSSENIKINKKEARIGPFLRVQNIKPLEDGFCVDRTRLVERWRHLGS